MTLLGVSYQSHSAGCSTRVSPSHIFICALSRASTNASESERRLSFQGKIFLDFPFASLVSCSQESQALLARVYFSLEHARNTSSAAAGAAPRIVLAWNSRTWKKIHFFIFSCALSSFKAQEHFKFTQNLLGIFLGENTGGGRNLERRNVERPIFRNFKIGNVKITKDVLFDHFIFEFNFSFFFKSFAQNIL